MKIKSQCIIGKAVFDEVVNPKWIEANEESKILLIYHDYRFSNLGMNLNKRSRMLSLYNSETFELINHLDTLKYPINDYFILSENSEIVIATGTYDGGYRHNGELLLWNYKSNVKTKLLKENREVIRAIFRDDSIEILLQPECDDSKDYFIKSYDLPFSREEESIENLPFQEVKEKIETKEYDTERNVLDVNKKFIALAKQKKQSYLKSKVVNDLCLSSTGKLFAAFDNALVKEINYETNEIIIHSLNEKSSCRQVIEHPKTKSILINQINVYPPKNFVTQLKSDSSQTSLIGFDGYLVQNQLGHIFCKQIEAYPGGDEHLDTIWNFNLKKKTQIRIGNYNGYQHFLKIDNQQNFYFFQGIDDYQYSKNLIQYNPINNKLTILYTFNKKESFVNPQGVKLDNKILFTGTRPANPTINIIFLFDLDSNEILWEKEIDNQIIKMKKINTKSILTLDSNGLLKVFSIHERNFEEDLSINFRVKYGHPISIDLRGDDLAIGYDNGLIELFKTETEYES